MNNFFYRDNVLPFSQLPLKMSRIFYDTSTLPQCIPNEGLDAIMRCRRCCIDNMFRILNNDDSEAVLRGITKQRTLECASKRVRTLEKSIWTRGTLLVPSLSWTLLWTPFSLFHVTVSSSYLWWYFSVPPQLKPLFAMLFDHQMVRTLVNAHILLIHLLNNWEDSSVLHKQCRIVNWFQSIFVLFYLF